MGADIHMVTERRWKPSDDEPERWVGVFSFPYARATIFDHTNGDWREVKGQTYWRMRDRNYDLFADLAGVRGEGPEPRGIPADISDLAAMEVQRWGGDGHSHTWYRLSECLHTFVRHQIDEARVAEIAQGALQGEPMAHRCGDVLSEFGISNVADEDTLDDYRLIIWFDN